MIERNSKEMNKDDIELLFTKELIKSEYVKATNSVISAKTRLRNAQSRQRLIKKAMFELGYNVTLTDEEEAME